MLRPPPISTRTDTLFPYTTLFRSTPACLARDDNLVALDPAGGLEIGQRRAGTRFRHRDRHDLVALDHVRNDPCLKRVGGEMLNGPNRAGDRKSTRLNSSH